MRPIAATICHCCGRLQVLLELRGQSDADFEELDESTQVNRIQVSIAELVFF